MNKFFYYNSSCSGSNLQSIFSIDPYVTAIKELLVAELKQVVYYIEKLRTLNFDMNEYTDKVIEFIAILIVNLDFTKENTFVIIEDLYNNKKMLEKMYISACEKSDIKPELFIHSTENLSSKDVILKALNEKEKNTVKSDVKITQNRKYLYEIMMNIVLNSCNNLIELKDYGVNRDEAKNKVLSFLNTINIPTLSDEELKTIIKNFAKNSYETTKYLYKTLENKFGPIIKSDVNICTKEGKSILISGTSYGELEKILNAVKGLNVNVYSYNEMLSAFQYEKFKNHPNFIGHYSNKENNIQSDFASFPGPVFVSKNSMPKIDVIRGRIFTSAKYPAFGISKIENDDFSPLIKSALDSKGFVKDYISKTIKIGYNKTELVNIIKNIAQKFKNNEINNIYIMGYADSFNTNSNYIKEFINIKSDNDFLISFSTCENDKNHFKVNSYLDFSILYDIIEMLIQEDENLKDKISIFLIDCNNKTVSHIFNLIHLEVKNIFIGSCCPNIVNPLLLEGLSDLFDIKPLTDPEKDIEIIKQNNPR